MKNSTQWLAVAALALTAGGSFAQKANETSAAVEFKNKYQSAMMQADMEAAKKSLTKAKEYIDLASANAETKESPKTLYYKGEIYSNFLVLGMQSMDTNFMKIAGDDALDVAIAAYKKGYTVSDKFDGDIKNAVHEKKILLENFTTMMFNNKMYKEAIEIYDYQVKLSDAIGVVDTLSIYNAGICAEKAEMYDKAAEYYKKCAELGYQSPGIYKTVAIALINAKKNEEATAFLEQAIQKNPNDKQLYYAIGSMYMEVNDEANALKNLRKAVEIDPNYLDAQYQLGAYLLEVGSKLRAKANDLPLKDPNYDKYISEGTVYYTEALPHLETYIKAVPNDQAVLMSLYQIYRVLKNTEKETEYKKRLDAAKQQ